MIRSRLVGRVRQAATAMAPDVGESFAGLIVASESLGSGSQIRLVAHAIQNVLPAGFFEHIDVPIDITGAGRTVLPDAQQLLQALGNAGRVHIVEPEAGVPALADAVVQFLMKSTGALVTLSHDPVVLSGRNLPGPLPWENKSERLVAAASVNTTRVDSSGSKKPLDSPMATQFFFQLTSR